LGLLWVRFSLLLLLLLLGLVCRHNLGHIGVGLHRQLHMALDSRHQLSSQQAESGQHLRVPDEGPQHALQLWPQWVNSCQLLHHSVCFCYPGLRTLDGCLLLPLLLLLLLLP
jgi:hypothetical protein